MDTANLYGDIGKNIYLAQPEGFDKFLQQGEILVCRLRKPINGLKQFGRYWWKHLDGYLIEIGYQYTHAEPSIYIQNDNSVYRNVRVYVDDLVTSSSTKKRTIDIANLLRKRYSIKQAQALFYHPRCSN